MTMNPTSLVERKGINKGVNRFQFRGLTVEHLTHRNTPKLPRFSEMAQNYANLALLPTDIWLLICDILPKKDIKTLSATGSHFNRICPRLIFRNLQIPGSKDEGLSYRLTTRALVTCLNIKTKMEPSRIFEIANSFPNLESLTAKSFGSTCCIFELKLDDGEFSLPRNVKNVHLAHFKFKDLNQFCRTFNGLSMLNLTMEWIEFESYTGDGFGVEFQKLQKLSLRYQSEAFMDNLVRIMHGIKPNNLLIEWSAGINSTSSYVKSLRNCADEMDVIPKLPSKEYNWAT